MPGVKLRLGSISLRKHPKFSIIWDFAVAEVGENLYGEPTLKLFRFTHSTRCYIDEWVLARAVVVVEDDT